MTGYLGQSLSQMQEGDPDKLVNGQDNEAFQQAVLNFQADTDGLTLDGEIAHPQGDTRVAGFRSPAITSATGRATADALARAVVNSGS